MIESWRCSVADFADSRCWHETAAWLEVLLARLGGTPRGHTRATSKERARWHLRWKRTRVWLTVIVERRSLHSKNKKSILTYCS